MTDDATPRSSTARTTAPAADGTEYGKTPRWRPRRPKLNAVRLLLQWAVSAAALAIAALIVPGVAVQGAAGALLAAGLIALLNAFLPPLIAALRLPFMLVVGFILVLLADAWMVMLAADLSERTFTVASFGSAVLVALVAAAVSIALQVVLGLNDDDTYSVRVIQRAAARSHDRVVTDVPGVVYLEIDGLARPVLQRAMRGGHAPNMARWVATGSHRLAEWETDLSSQTGASQAGLLLGSNDDIPAFRWVEKESGAVMTCSAPSDCEEIERRHGGRGLLADGGASRGNLLSGGADQVILTVSRMAAEKEANPGYRAFLANGYNVTRTLVLFVYELVLEWVAAARSARRDIQPRGHRPLKYGFVRAGLGVFVRDLTVYSIIDDMMKGRPAIYACFAGYDEVAHHSGLERDDAMEVLRKIDQQFERISRARAYAARPYEIVVLSDHGQTQGATFLQRNGYGLDELVQRSVEQREVAPLPAGDENDSALGQAVREATGRRQQKPGKKDVSGQDVVVLGSGNLGLVYLMEEPRRLTLEEIDRRHPRLLPTLRAHPHVGWLLVRSENHGPVALGSRGVRYLSTGTVEGDDPLAAFSPSAAQHLLRTDGFPHVADIMVNSFYDEQLDEGCAFEELISFHGGMGGSQTRPFLLHPSHLPLPATPLVGAEQVHEVLAGWRRWLQDGDPEGAETSSEQTAPRGSAPEPHHDETPGVTMKRYLKLILVPAVVAAAVLLLAACGSGESTADPSPTVTPSVAASVVPGTITDAARSGDLGAFLSAVAAAGLQKQLEEAGPFTVFAPSNEALGAITLDQLKQNDSLKDVIAYHIVPGVNVKLAETSSGDTFVTDEGGSLTITFDGGATLVNDATVVRAYAGTDWTLYVVDRVLFPPDSTPSS